MVFMYLSFLFYYNLSNETKNFAVRLGLVDEKDGKDLLYTLERELSALHDAFTAK